MTSSARILVGDCVARLRELDAESVQTCITSPPYWGLRDYGVSGQIGLEESPERFVERLVEVFREVRRVLRRDGTLWLNLGDTYIGGRSGGIGTSALTSQRNHGAARAAWLAQGGRKHRVVDGMKPKDLVGIPWMVAFALRADGWYLRCDIVWSKPSPMPESVRDRPTRAHEYLFLLSRSERYLYDASAIAEPIEHPEASSAKSAARAFARRRATVPAPHQDAPTLEKPVPQLRNKRSVWTVAQQPFGEAHFATFPPRLVEPCVLAGSRVGDTVLDPFSGAGTTGLVALRHARAFVGVELNPTYAAMSERRIRGDMPLLADVQLDDGHLGRAS